MKHERDCRVLIVDDDFMVARIHRGFVERMPGFVVAGEAHTAETALNAARRLLPDIILLDIYLPDMSGLRALAELRRGTGSTCDVIIVTAAREAETVSESLRLGARHYLIKPFGFEDLSERLKQVRDFRQQFQGDSARDLAQKDVDLAFSSSSGVPPQSRPLPSGLSNITMSLVVATLKTSTTEHTAVSLAELTGISRVSARRYLDFLVKIGWVRIEPRYGEVGRPVNEYRWVHG